MQPLLFVFVFAYVFPKIGGGFNLGGGASAAPGGINFATILVPGLMASMLLMQGIMAVTFPLVMEFSWQRTIEDRALAPVPIRVLAIQKIVAGAVQSFIGACIVFPIVLLVHAAGQAPHVHVTNWAPARVILVAASLLTALARAAARHGHGSAQNADAVRGDPAAGHHARLRLLPLVGAAPHPLAADRGADQPDGVHVRGPARRADPRPRPYAACGASCSRLVGGTVVFSYLGTRTFTNRVLN